ncbi:MAG: ABC transporter permease [Methanobacteriota archaeon]|nr:MAG: ABC transporter permease [Euryarchaeota archaeon]
MKHGTKILARKIFNSIITLLLVIIINFILFRMMPGDPINFMVPNDPRIPHEYKLELIEKYGLRDPLLEQFFTYFEDVLTLDFGDSFIFTNTPAMDIVIENLKWTLVLTGTSSILMIVIGMTIGIYAAWKRGSSFDTGSLAFSLFFYAMPTFWLAMMLIIVFALHWELFPPDSALTYGETFEFSISSIVDLLRHLVLPATCLTLVSIGAFVLIMRGSLIDVMTEEYITTAKAKGLTDSETLKHHAVPNAMLPMVALIAIDIAYIVGGAFQTEYVFNYPGIGWTTIDAVYKSDWPILQAAFFLIALAVIVANLIADILLVYMDPRVKMG